MKRHTITEQELNEWLAQEAWRRFASSAGDDSHKTFEVNAAGMFRVMDHGKEVYVGFDKAAAIEAYNAAP